MQELRTAESSVNFELRGFCSSLRIPLMQCTMLVHRGLRHIGCVGLISYDVLMVHKSKFKQSCAPDIVCGFLYCSLCVAGFIGDFG